MLLMRNQVLLLVTETHLKSPTALGHYFPLKREIPEVGDPVLMWQLHNCQYPVCLQSINLPHCCQETAAPFRVSAVFTQEELELPRSGVSPDTLSSRPPGQNCSSLPFLVPRSFNWTQQQQNWWVLSVLTPFADKKQMSEIFHGFLVLNMVSWPGGTCPHCKPIWESAWTEGQSGTETVLFID